MLSLLHRIRDVLSAFRPAQGGNVAIVFGLSLIPLIGVVGAAVDYSRGNSAKTDMQAALDATALMLAKNTSVPTWTQGDLNGNASNIFRALFNRPEATGINVTGHYTPGAAPTIAVTGSATLQSAFMGGILGLLGNPNASTMTISASATSTYGSPQTLQLNIVFDSSASMIVGATPADVTLISNWVTAHWDLVKPGDPAPNYPGGDNPPCAFACHDVGGSTTASDIVQGLTNAHAANATTQFDVMISAGRQLITHVQTEHDNNPMLRNNTYLFNVMSFDTSVHTWGGSNLSFANATQAVSSVTPGLDTYLSSAMSTLITRLGTQGDGTSTSSPLKFLILITDGLQSDRSRNWSGGHWAQDSAWNYNTYFGGYATTIDQTQCRRLKDNGIILAVLETPYVPLTGQSPKVAPYEKTVRKVVYPGGPNTGSAVSTALSQCASTGYYFQATTAADIATGFLALSDKFIYNTPYLTR